jgi:hypothetical protein
VVLVTFGFTVKFNVAKESQPAAETNVFVCEPATKKVSPFHVYGNEFWQIVVLVVLVTFGFTVKFNVANESQPAAETNVFVCDPAAAKVNPFHKYGNEAGQMVVFVVLETVGFTVRFNVAIESQPFAATNVAVCEPAVAKVKPFHKYGKTVVHIVLLVVLEALGLMVIVIEAVAAHCPTVGVNVYNVVVVLSMAGAHVPVMPLVEVVGNAPMAEPEQ